MARGEPKQQEIPPPTRAALLNPEYSDLTAVREHPTTRTVAHPRWALCLGGASCVWDDVLAFETLYGKPWDGLVIAANDVGSHWPRDLDHWVSLHAYKLPRWQQQRAVFGFTSGYKTWGRRPDDRGVDYTICTWGGGSSGFMAAQVALEIGCKRVVLCGIPMTQTPHFAETRENFHVFWVAAHAHWGAWEKCRSRLGDNVRSMSGRTEKLLGAPTLAWLQEGVA